MDQLQRLSRTAADERVWAQTHEIVVVGTGYGGSIAASRLARAGRQVTVLERGRELHPGDFPASELAALAHVQVTPSRLPVTDRRNLYWLHAGEQLSVMSGCGLGGTSLINANVSIEPEESVLQDQRWPEGLRADPAGLERGFARAREVLQPNPYPASYPTLNSVTALRRAGAGQHVFEPAINVRFQSGPNAVGVEQAACTGCGDCVTGCNVGAKNTLLMNYLPDAVGHGAALFTEIEVDRVEKGDQGGWTIWARSLAGGHPIAQSTAERPTQRAAERTADRTAEGDPLRPIRAQIVVLAGGTMGSTAILLRSRAHLALSTRLGSAFTGNGDVLGFADRTKVPVDGVGAGEGSLDPQRLAGPCITAAIDYRQGDDPDRVMLIENAVIPGALANAVDVTLAGESMFGGLRRLLRLRLPRPGFVESVLRRGLRGAVDRTQTYLVMGIDDGDGSVVLEDGEASVRWSGVGDSPYYRQANDVLRSLAAKVSGRGDYLHDVIWSRVFGRSLITVHPLGGCPMADDAGHGVVDHAGRVFDPSGGTAVHDGLYVTDGSIVPLPLGVNPLLTISALAERNVALLAEERGWSIDYSLPTPVAVEQRPTVPPPLPTLRFSETMTGFWSAGRTPGAVPADFARPEEEGRTAGRRLRFDLTMTAVDVRQVIEDTATTMFVEGTVVAPDLSPDPLIVDGGRFQLCVPVAGAPNAFRMVYHLPLTASDGSRLELNGFKVIDPGALDDLWPETTTLYVTIERAGQFAGSGVMRLSAENFARLLRTMTVSGSVGHRERLELLAAFGGRFAGILARDYGHVVHPSTPMRPNAPPRVHRPLDVPLPEVHPVVTDDGVHLRLTRYNGGAGRSGGSRATVLLSHGMGANPLTFSTDLIRPNLVEFLTGHGYDVWLQEWRGSTLLPGVQTASFNGDQVARFDHPATHRKVAEVAGTDSIHWVTHCVGSMTVLMSTLGDHLHPASLVCSSAGAHPVASRLIRFKTGLHVAELLERLGVKRLTTDSFEGESAWERVFDRVVRLNWVPADERCDEAVCHRLEFIYGVATHHAAIDDVSHAALHELFGVTNLDMLAHLSECARRRSLVDANGADVYLPNLDRLDLPITFLHGKRNLVWLPESSDETFDLLTAAFGPHHYRRRTFAEHGHQDLLMGTSAPRDTFPSILEHLETWA